MKNSLLKVALALILSLAIAIPQKAKASHAAGGELLYEWVSGSTYKLIFKFYRDCSGISEPSSQQICYRNTCNSFTGTVTLTKDPNSGAQVTVPCPGQNLLTKCDVSSSPIPGYREWIYEGTVTLPSQCDYWTFSASIGSRNPQDNITAGNFYTEATLNNLVAEGNSSPTFTVKPVPYVCANVPYQYNNGAFDVNNDSLHFEMIQPGNGPCAGPIGASNWLPAFNASTPPPSLINNPFFTNGTFNLNSSTGVMSFTPSQLQISTIAIRCNEYRNGIKIGSVIRDVQVIVRACTIPQPNIDLDVPTLFNCQFVDDRIEACALQNFTFCYAATSGDTSIMINVSDNSAAIAPNSNVNYVGNGSDSVYGCFNWTPSVLDTGLKLFVISIQACDPQASNPPITQSFTIPIYIWPVPIASNDKTICLGDSIQLSVLGGGNFQWSVLPGGDQISSLSCTSCSNPVATPNQTTSYVVTSTVNSFCVRNTDTVRIFIDNTNGVEILPSDDPVVVCRDGYLNLDANGLGPVPLINFECGFGTPATGVPMISNVGDLTYYSNTHSPFQGGATQSVRTQYLIRKGELHDLGILSSTFFSIGFNMVAPTATDSFYDITIKMKCTDKDELDAGDGFEVGLVNVYTATGPVTFVNGWNSFPFDNPYNWDSTKNIVIEICYSNPSTSTVAAPEMFYTHTNFISALIQSSGSGSACALTTGVPSAVSVRPDIRLETILAPEGGYSYVWHPGWQLSDSMVESPVAYVDKSISYMVTTVGRNGCQFSDFVNIYNPEPEYSINPMDTSICLGDETSIILGNFGSIGLSPNYTVQWYQNNYEPAEDLDCTTCSIVYATPKADVRYIAVVTDSVGCKDTLTSDIEVRPLPVVNILNNDTTVKYGSQVQLLASGGYLYQWHPAGTINNPIIPNPIAQPVEPTMYTVYVVGTNGCPNQDSVKIDIDYRDNLFVPSAFSPNGDGKNDVFRIFNLSFQKVMEFRVFNRYGQEIFSTVNPTEGWDGKWKGVPQDIGTYYYIIRVAFPDGYVETYKGNVTLVK